MDDLECMTFVQSEGRGFLFVVPSFSLKQRKKHLKRRANAGNSAPPEVAS